MSIFSKKCRRVMRVGMYIMLLMSAGLSFFFSDRLWRSFHTSQTPAWIDWLAPAIFVVFIITYSIDRFLMVRRFRYSPSRALLQIGFAIIFLTLLLPQSCG